MTFDFRTVCDSLDITWTAGPFESMPRLASAKLLLQVQTMRIGPSFWSAKMTTQPLDFTQQRRLRPYIDRAIGGERFWLWDPTQNYPLNHDGGAIAGGWSDALAVSAVTATAITCTGANNNLSMAEGDLVGLEQGGKYSLHRLVSNVVPSAGFITMQVTPRITTSFFGAGATLRLRRPICEMMIPPDSPPDVGSGQYLDAFSFRAMQAVL